MGRRRRDMSSGDLPCRHKYKLFTEEMFKFRKNLGISVGQFSQMEEEELEEMLELELWEKEKFKVWKVEKDAEQRIKMAQSGR